MNKAFEELDVLDDFLMNAIASNEEVGIPFCRRILSVLLQREIGEIRVTAQAAIPALTPQMRGIRMDVEIEEPELKYDDGLRFVYFNTKGTKGGSEEIKSMLQYIQDSTEDNVINEATREIHDYVTRVKVLPEVKQGYMKFEELMAYAERKGLEVGIEKGIQQGMQQGMQQGRKQSILEILQDYGEISIELRQKIEQQEEQEILKRWCKLAAKVDTIQEFESKMDLSLV